MAQTDPSTEARKGLGRFPVILGLSAAVVVLGTSILLVADGDEDSAQSALYQVEENGEVQRPTGAGSLPDGVVADAQGSGPANLDESEILEGSTVATDLTAIDPKGAVVLEEGSTTVAAPGGRTVLPSEGNTAPGAGEIDDRTGTVRVDTAQTMGIDDTTDIESDETVEVIVIENEGEAGINQ